MQGVIIDLGGTLIDARPFFLKAALINSRIFKKYGINIAVSDIIKARKNILPKADKCWRTKRFPGFFSKLICEDMNIEIDNNISEKMDRDFSKCFASSIKIKPGAIELLKKIQKTNTRMVLLSTYDKISTNDILKRFNIKKFFYSVVTIEETGEGKLDGRAWKFALKKLKIPIKNTFAIGDNIWEDMIPAAKLGMKTILIGSHANTNFYDIRDAKNNIKGILLCA